MRYSGYELQGKILPVSCCFQFGSYSVPERTLGHTIRTTSSQPSHESRAALKGACRLQQVDEFAHGNARLSKNRGESPSGEFPVSRDNDHSAHLIPEFHVTTSLADLYEANLPERSDGLLAGNNG